MTMTSNEGHSGQRFQYSAIQGAVQSPRWPACPGGTAAEATAPGVSG